MLIGKTNVSLTAEEILQKASELQILSAVFPEVHVLPCLICSPLRNDKHPSFSLFLDRQNKVRFRDFADSSMAGGLYDLLCKYWNCSYPEALTRVSKMIVYGNIVNIRKPRDYSPGEQRLQSNTDIQVKVRDWRDYDWEYWESYGITKQWLMYAEVYPISHEIITRKREGEAKTFTVPCDKHAYCFVERKEGKIQLKIYQPFNKMGFKWTSKMDGSVIGLWTKIPQTGDRVVICSSLKDALCVSCQLHIPTLCLQGEGYGISNTAANELKRRYKKVYIAFDTDKAGLIDSEKLAMQTGFINVVPDLGNEKDFSDYYKSLENKNDFQELKKIFT